MSKKNPLTQHHLLNELESIHSWLNEEKNTVNHFVKHTQDNITSVELKQKNSKNQSSTYKKTNSQSVKRNNTSSYTNPLPGQQSLFDEKKLTQKTPKNISTSPIKNTDGEKSLMDEPILDENPFLPKHIRKRLNNEHKNAMSDLSDISNQLQSNNSEVFKTLKKTELQYQRIHTKEFNQTQLDRLIKKHVQAFEKSLREYVDSLSCDAID